MRVACIYFKRPNYHPLAMEAQIYRQLFRAAGHTFDVLPARRSGISDPKLHAYDEIHPGIMADGEIPYSQRRSTASNKWLQENYDAILFLGSCPAPGDVGPWEALYHCKLPKVVILCDNVENQWGDEYEAPPNVIKTFASHQHLMRDDSKPLPIPFIEPPVGGHMPVVYRRVVWTGRWSAQSGIKEFLKQVPAIAESSSVYLRGTGPFYRVAKKSSYWSSAISTDCAVDADVPDLPGGAAEYIPTDVTHRSVGGVLMGAWASVDLTGRKVRSNAEKTAPAYTYATLYSLYWGIWPVVAEQEWAIPHEFLKQVHEPDASDLPGLIAGIDKPLAHTEHRGDAREWVLTVHDGQANMDELIETWGF